MTMNSKLNLYNMTNEEKIPVYELKVTPNCSESCYASMMATDKTLLEDAAREYENKEPFTITIQETEDDNLLVDCIRDGWEWRGFYNQLAFVPSTTLQNTDRYHSKYNGTIYLYKEGYPIIGYSTAQVVVLRMGDYRYIALNHIKTLDELYKFITETNK